MASQFVRPNPTPPIHTVAAHKALAPDSPATKKYAAFTQDDGQALPPLPHLSADLQSADWLSGARGNGSAGSYRVAAAAKDEIVFAGEKPDAERLFSLGFGKLLLADTRHVLSAPLRWDRHDWLKMSLATMGVAATQLLDGPVREDIAEHKGKVADNIANTFEPFGVEYAFGVLGGFYLSGLAFDNPESRAVALDGLAASVIAAGIITPALKFTVGRARPSSDEGDLSFHPFSGDTSFPSGHTTQAFAVASVIADHYDPLWVDLTAYGVASMVGLARMEQDMHFVSDVVAGALIGTAVGKAVVHFNAQRRAARNQIYPTIMPLVGGDALGLTISFSF